MEQEKIKLLARATLSAIDSLSNYIGSLYSRVSGSDESLDICCKCLEEMERGWLNDLVTKVNSHSGKYVLKEITKGLPKVRYDEEVFKNDFQKNIQDFSNKITDIEEDSQDQYITDIKEKITKLPSFADKYFLHSGEIAALIANDEALLRQLQMLIISNLDD